MTIIDEKLKSLDDDRWAKVELIDDDYAAKLKPIWDDYERALAKLEKGGGK